MLSFDINFLQDQNLNLHQLESSSQSFEIVCIKNRRETFIEIEKTSTIGELREKYCHGEHLDVSSIRFLFNGEWLEYKDIIATMGIKEGGKIEAYEECKGEGPPGKTGILDDDDKIIEALNASSDNDDTASESSSDESKCESAFSTSVQSKRTTKLHFTYVCESEIVDIRKDPVEVGQPIIGDSNEESQDQC